MRDIEPLISGFSHLKDKRRGPEALKTLQKIASLVKPIMRQRGWRVGSLTEFYPQERNLLGLNWNKGQEICLRLRYAGDDTQFLPLEQVLDTMLHELSHIVHNDHDANFHALWQQLREEHENLARKGYTGEGFLAQGKKLGGRRIPLDEARRQARASAESRRIRHAGSGQRLGGTAVGRGADMRQVIADAVQRRLTVTKGCASGTKDSKAIRDQATRNGFRTQAEEDDANEQAIMQAYIELLQEEEKEKWGDAYLPPSRENPAGSAQQPEIIDDDDDDDHDDDDDDEDSEDENTSSSSTRNPAQPLKPAERPFHGTLEPQSRDRSPPHSSTRSRSPINTPEAPHSWTCPICTLENPQNYLCCDACTTERPSDSTLSTLADTDYDHPSSDRSERRADASRPPKPTSSVSASTSSGVTNSSSSDWVCHRCATYMEGQWWTCSNCGTMKLSS